MDRVWVRVNHGETEFGYTAGLSRSKFAGALLVVESFWSGEGRRVVVVVLLAGEMISFCAVSLERHRCRGERVERVGGFSVCRPKAKAIAILLVTGCSVVKKTCV